MATLYKLDVLNILLCFFLRLHKNAFGYWQQKIDFRLTYFTCWLVSGSSFQLQFVGTVALLISQLAFSPCGVAVCWDSSLANLPAGPLPVWGSSSCWFFSWLQGYSALFTSLGTQDYFPQLCIKSPELLSDQTTFDQITVRSQKKVIYLIGLAHMWHPPGQMIGLAA